MGTQKNRLNETSFEHPKHMFKLMGKEIITILCSQIILIWTYGIYTNCMMNVLYLDVKIYLNKIVLTLTVNVW